MVQIIRLAKGKHITFLLIIIILLFFGFMCLRYILFSSVEDAKKGIAATAPNSGKVQQNLSQTGLDKGDNQQEENLDGRGDNILPEIELITHEKESEGGFFSECRQDIISGNSTLAFSFAVFYDDEDYCSLIELEEEKLWCFSEYYELKALSRRSSEFCEKIEDLEISIGCSFMVSLLNHENPKCPFLDDVRNSMCEAMSAHSPDYCKFLKDEDNSECLDVLNKYLAFYEMDSFHCLNISSPLYRDICRASLGENIDTGMEEARINITCFEELQLKKDRVHLDNGVNKMNYSFCAMIHNSDMAEACFSVIERDLDRCLSVDDSGARLLCASNIIEASGGNESDCNFLKDEGLIKSCIEFLRI